jgi:hypothetical protein
MLTMHLCKFGFMLGYDVWMHHSERIHQRTASMAEDEDDRMNEMFDAIRSELETNHEDPPTPEVQKFFDLLRASEELLHEHMKRPCFRHPYYVHQVNVHILKQMLQGAVKPVQRCPS